MNVYVRGQIHLLLQILVFPVLIWKYIVTIFLLRLPNSCSRPMMKIVVIWIVSIKFDNFPLKNVKFCLLSSRGTVYFEAVGEKKCRKRGLQIAIKAPKLSFFNCFTFFKVLYLKNYGLN